MSNIDRFLLKNRYTNAIEKDDNMIKLFTSEFNKYCTIHFKCSPKSDIITLNAISENQYHIIWDVSFWDLFLEFIYIMDETNFSPSLDVNTLAENSGFSMALFLNYLSKRYSYYPEIASRLAQNATAYGYQILIDNLYGNLHEKQYYDFHILVCKQFVFWHEFAHIEFHKFDNDTSLYQKHIKLIYSILDTIFEDKSIQEISLFSESIQKIKTRTISPDLIEELAADLRAFQRLLQFEAIYDVKNNLDRSIKSIVTLIDFIIVKSTMDEHWDHYVLNKIGTPQTLIENQIIRRFLFPLMLYIRYGNQNLGYSFFYDIKEKYENTTWFTKSVGIIEREWFIKNMLGQESNGNFHDIYEDMVLLNTISYHMTNITSDTSAKRLKYLFNVAHTAQHSSTPLNCIQLFDNYLEQATRKENENKRNIGDAYSRMARIYAEDGQRIKAEILICRAVDIAQKLTQEDIYSAFLFNNIGNVFELLGRDDEALKYYNNSMKIRSKHGDLNSTSMATVYRNLGHIFWKKQNYPRSLKYYLESYRILKHRLDKDDPILIKIRNDMKFFTGMTSNVSEFNISMEIPLSDLQSAYLGDTSNENLLRQYLRGIIRDLAILPFDNGCDLFIELVELVEKNTNNPSLFVYLIYGIINFKKSLLFELE